MEKCVECNGKMKEFEGVDPNGLSHRYYKCLECGDEILNMKQLHEAAEKYRKLKKYNTKISKWGTSLGLRIPKELAKKYGFKDKKEIVIIPEKEGIKIFPI